MEDDKDEIVLDLSKIENTLKKTINGTKIFFTKNNYIVPILLILVAIFFSTYFRAYPLNLPITEVWAEDTVYNNIRSDLSNQVSEQNPNLPDAQRQILVNQQFDQLVKENKELIDPQIEQLSNSYRARFQDQDGQTYLLAIDPYLWYGYSKNYLECGHTGCDLNEDGDYKNYRNGRFGKDVKMNYLSIFGAYVYKFMNIFSNTSLLTAFFLLPLIIIGLATIPAFLLGKRLGGNLGGFFAAMIVAVNAALLGRTPGGFSDTDSTNILLPLLIMWLFLEAFYSKSWKKTTIYSVLLGIAFYIYSSIWRPYHMFDFLLAASAIYVLIIIIIDKVKHKSFNLKRTIEQLKTPILKLTLPLTISLTFLIISRGFNIIPELVTMIIGFARQKDVAVSTLWPNVKTTVAEFNVVPFVKIVAQMGGTILFILAILGIILVAIKKDKEGKRNILFAALLIIWFLATAYSFTKGTRFAILMVPAFAVACGTGAGILYEILVKWLTRDFGINTKIIKTVLIVIFCFLLISPIKAADRVAINEIPSYNDAWDQTLNKIKLDAEDGIGYITTWWDFGHWFVAKDIRVTFDGGDQRERIYWVGKSLLTPSEDESIGILQILNCGQEKPQHLLEKYFQNDTVKSVEILNTIMVQNKGEAIMTLQDKSLSAEQIENLTAVTHCDDLLPQYFITSQDMVGKAGVWGHFGSWNFTKAKIWQTVNPKNFEEGTKILTEEFNISKEEAPDMYYDIQRTKADSWIAPWPGYFTGQNSCIEQDNILKCQNGVEVDLKTMQATIYTQNGKFALKSISYIDTTGDFKVMEGTGNLGPYSALLLPDNRAILVDPLHADSMFTRLFYFEGHGLEHFKLFSDTTQVTGGRIQVWKINWDGGEINNVFGPDENI